MVIRRMAAAIPTLQDDFRTLLIHTRIQRPKISVDVPKNQNLSGFFITMIRYPITG
jgi:hypothetical protein